MHHTGPGELVLARTALESLILEGRNGKKQGSDPKNIVFHFRRGITPKDTDRLRRFRDRLRYDRELYAKQKQAEPAAT